MAKKQNDNKTKKCILLTIIALIIVLAGCLYSLYWVLFSAWMTAYYQDNYQIQIWRNNFYVWLGILIGLIIAEISGIYWIVLKVKKGEK